MDAPVKELRPSQLKALEALMHGATLREAAKAAKVSHPTIQNWLYQDPNFREVFEEQKRVLLNEVGYKAPLAIAKAFDVLLETFEHKDLDRDKHRTDTALNFLRLVFGKGNNINIIQQTMHDDSQHLTVQTGGAPLDAKTLDPNAIGTFVEALRLAANPPGAGERLSPYPSPQGLK